MRFSRARSSTLRMRADGKAKSNISTSIPSRRGTLRRSSYIPARWDFLLCLNFLWSTRAGVTSRVWSIFSTRKVNIRKDVKIADGGAQRTFLPRRPAFSIARLAGREEDMEKNPMGRDVFQREMHCVPIPNIYGFAYPFPLYRTRAASVQVPSTLSPRIQRSVLSS